jgi:hypothetical protein
VALSTSEISTRFARLRARYSERDRRMLDILAVRQGRMREVFPDLFPADGPFDKAIVANMVDVAARDLAETTAPLPAFNCSSSSNVSDAARKFADKRTKIATGYVELSDLQRQMYSAADRYYTYGFTVAQVEVDPDAQSPRIRFLDSIGAYPVIDRFGRVTAFYQRLLKSRDELAAQYPEFARQIHGDQRDTADLIELVRYHDAEQDVLFLPTRENLVLDRAKNLAGEVLVRVAMRPGVDDEAHGQFDDVLAVQVAKARFALLSLEAATKSVQAPIAIPQDVVELALGPDALLRSANPEKIRRVPIELPSGAFAQQQVLDQEMRLGSRYPETRTGNTDASVITGRGVQMLNGGFDTQIKTAQAMFARMFVDLIGLCFRVDEALFGDLDKTLRGNDHGTPYEIKYRPSKDIKGDYSIDVQYGLMAGLDPNRALVFGLQARGDKLISRDFLRRQMPFSFNATEEEQKLDIEEMREALKQAVSGYAQAIPVLAQAGQDPGDVLARMAQIIEGRQKGEPIEKVVSEAFAPQAPPEGVAPPDDPMMGPAGAAPSGGAEDLEGLDPFGRINGVAEGQRGMAPGGRPDLNVLLAGLTGSGQPNLQASVSRRMPV